MSFPDLNLDSWQTRRLYLAGTVAFSHSLSLHRNDLIRTRVSLAVSRGSTARSPICGRARAKSTT